MRKETRRVKTFITRAYCDECGEELKYQGPGDTMFADVFISGKKATYKHVCQNGHIENLESRYPGLFYEEDKE